MPEVRDSPGPAVKQRFLEDLPWYVNGTLDAQERPWVEDMLKSSSWARQEHAFELEIVRATRAQLGEVPEMPVADLLQRARAAGQPAGGNRGTRAPMPADSLSSRLFAPLRALVALVSQPNFALGLLAVVALQTATLGWFAWRGAEDAEATRSAGGQHGAPSIRIRVATDVRESSIRSALQGAGVTIVQGPNELGEYLVRPTGVKSLDEALVALRSSPAFVAVERVP